MALEWFPVEWTKIPDISDVLATAEIVKWQISAMWANDCEFGIIHAIVEQARSGTLNCTEAILQIQGVQDSKQDYH